MTATMPAAGRPLAEKNWQATVVDAATRLNWMVYHTHDSRRSTAGFPDLILVRGDRLMVIELKIGRNKLRPAQVAWLEAFDKVREITVRGPVYPDDWDMVESLLKATEAE